ncbi:MAG: bifunctional UDP-N-acetylglucosamine diphosphorylase/glucosamine-1-phosphate N-acetyltransferase GlmU [Alphaproteobacteria bacterium]|jgi:bifunctional UDP-N-acetylglucosamine pyrophosphorylase/glucosamine-1-phosphate N-acetyltransferase|nr:bifunctional UDP-N-acetylglucosamine diphosphorylase/glucosamine-1-phosphate N-acetyltransferase GlmU [Alphaproteobacteria bacterium]
MNTENNKLTVLILAAGIGSRMKSSIPKAMHILGGVPMIDHLLYKSKQLNPSQIISVIGEDMPELQEHIIDRCDVIHQTKRLGSGHAVYTTKYVHALKEGITLVLYADTPLVEVETLQKLVDKVSSGDADICVLGFENYDDNSYGRLVVEDENLLRIVEKKDLQNDEKDITLCNSGVMAIKTEIIWDLIEKINNENANKEYYLTDIVEIATEQSHKCSFILDDEETLQGANTKLQLAELEVVFQSTQRMKFLEQGVQLIDPDTTYFSLDTKIGKDVVIYPNVYILPNSEIKDSCIIYPFSVVEGATIGEKSKVGPFARLRPGTELKGENHIGNFVEIKKSTIDIGSKVNHLTYIGDTTIGKKVNVGAGTITCNYDGVNKFNTTIGDNCFIGSNTALVAPVKVADGAIIGAGSVITKDVEKDNLAVSRSPQRNIPKKK